jgi:ATP/maltotriose-dependent transcriptional regulator MalT
VTHMKAEHDNLLLNLKVLQSKLIESVRGGILLISEKPQPIYLNLKAREIYHQLWQGSSQSTQLPPILSDIFHQFVKGFHPEDELLILDYQVSTEQTIRIRACQFIHELDPDQQYILVFLEDRNAVLAEDLKVEQKKYDLTDRESQILHLLLQAYSYQDISETLQISLNTVKFHVKNIYSKKRGCLEQDGE